MTARFRLFTVIAAMAALAGCKSSGELVIDQGVGITALRSACPAIGIPDYTGDVTLFWGADRTADAIDIVAAMTNVRSSCNDTGEKIYSEASFDILVRRTDIRGARTVELPYFATVLRGGNSVVSKRVGTAKVNFADGQERASVSAKAGAFIDRAEATLSREIVRRINKKRRSGENDAAVDPLTEPDVKAALARANFELLVGFQLSEEQLSYNATR